MTTNRYTRRRALQILGAGGAAWIAQDVARASELPIKTSGLEHIGMQVPDQEATAKFYGRIFDPPSTSEQAFRFLDALLKRPHCCVLRPGAGHWAIFRQLCEEKKLQGKLVPDAAHAALAIETGCEWVSADTDFARFAPQLRWQHL